MSVVCRGSDAGMSAFCRTLIIITACVISSRVLSHPLSYLTPCLISTRITSSPRLISPRVISLRVTSHPVSYLIRVLSTPMSDLTLLWCPLYRPSSILVASRQPRLPLYHLAGQQFRPARHTTRHIDPIRTPTSNTRATWVKEVHVS